ncbi:RecQ family ATP-dependent DNA helicase [Parabacteroides sp. OttesenSCG-928-K15]|nr:RecQ family ATP-dependent DNA helicase [Parabacteroides sp. OttesenSCG-928-K15]
MNTYLDILQKYWGHNAFRPLQEDIIRSVCAGQDTLGLMPTGGGKSITFQVPAMAMEGLCLVVTPLIALMKDQVDNLRRLGIKATAVYSGMRREEIITQLENCIFGNYKFLYISPERLNTEIFQAKLQAMQVNLLVVDECHCISQWGYDFRPSYLKIADIRELLPGVPVLALTATATPEVVNDIQEKLRFSKKNVFQKSFLRPNLSYTVRRTDEKFDQLTYILNQVRGSAIVYVRNRKRTQEIAEYLKSKGISADFFHAGLNRAAKEVKQNLWKSNECRVIVSTNAFGMGIDKPDVRLVIHIDMPGSLEEYFQEAGRAGRDEQKAYAVVLCSGIDNSKLKKRLADEFPDKEYIARVYEALGNYYQVAVGFGLDTVHDFMLEDFCHVFKFSMLQAHHALKILDLSGYIEYTEEIENASRLRFTATREELYRYLRQDPVTDSVLHVILRTYTGLFADYVYINETTIATKAGVTQQQVYDLLINLSKYRIVSYIPQKKTPLIVYTQTREELKYLSIPRSAYEDRKKRFETRIQKVLEYMDNDTVCRSRMLLRYFGEKDSRDCGICDVCKARHHTGLANHEFHAIRASLEAILTEKPVEVKTLVHEIPFPMDKTLQTIRFLADNDPSYSLRDGYISFISNDK